MTDAGTPGGRALGLRLLVLLLAAAAIYRLSFAFARLWFNYLDWANVDLRFFHSLVGEWFAGASLSGSVYPPATYAMLWPFLGWLEVPQARSLWGFVSIALLGALSIVIARAAPARRLEERIAWMLLPAAGYSVSATIGNGQLGLHVMAPLLLGVLILGRKESGWGTDLLAAGLILASLVKPTISAPFFWIVIFAFARWRSASLVVAGYGAISLVAVGLRKVAAEAAVAAGAADTVVSTDSAIGDAVAGGVQGVAIGSKEAGGGYANVHDWLTAAGYESLNLPVSMLLLALVGAWVFRHRRQDLWILLGVAALAGRFWAYHRLHDDLMVLPAIVALARVASVASGDWRRVAVVLAALVGLGTLAPAGLLFSPFPVGLAFDLAQTALWGGALVFLLAWVERGRGSDRIPILAAMPAG